MKNYKIKTSTHSYSRRSVDPFRDDQSRLESTISEGKIVSLPGFKASGQISIQEGFSVDEPSKIDETKNEDLMSRIRNLTQVAKTRIAFSKESLESSERQPINAFLTHVNVIKNQAKENIPQNKSPRPAFNSDPDAITQELKQFLANDVCSKEAGLDRRGATATSQSAGRYQPLSSPGR